MSSPVSILGPFPIPHVGSRHVRLHLPHHVGKGAAPLLVMFDGQNVFDDAPSFAGGWHLHKAVRKVATKKRLEPAVVGLDHGGVDRIHDLIPWASQRSHGNLNHVIDWMVGFLLPMLAQRYGLNPPIEKRIIGGSSLGGLAALYTHHRNPEAFGGVMAMSPSLWVGGERIFDTIASTSRPWTSRIYLDAGVHEARGSMLKSAARLSSLLASRGYQKDSLRFRADPKGHHSEKDWKRRAPAAIRFLLPAPKGRKT
ncbi:MAG: alpha/beta hydrolase [Polyangiaceae bacterium]|nr:alpha/beta hydrolase [Polyangiaceae bacterium]